MAVYVFTIKSEEKSCAVTCRFDIFSPNKDFIEEKVSELGGTITKPYEATVPSEDALQLLTQELLSLKIPCDLSKKPVV